MGFWYYFFIGVSLAMDSFTVTIAKTMANPKMKMSDKIKMPIMFGLFQGMLPAIGYFLGINFADYIKAYDHWIAFILLTIIGGNMIKESLSKEEENYDDDMSWKTLVILAIATAIDAMAVGVSFSFLEANIVEGVVIFTVVTFLICCIGLLIGKKGGEFLKDKAGLAGGIVLIGIGIKILIEHLFF